MELKFGTLPINGIRSTEKISLGAFPDLSLAYAREIATEYRGLILRNIDPLEYRNSSNIEEKKITFAEMAIRWRDKRLKIGKT